MTLEQAIDILTDLSRRPALLVPAERHEAVSLGIEALKEIERARTHGYRFAAVRLPGETDCPSIKNK